MRHFDGSGGWYVGGSFSTIGGIARTNLARIKSDKTVNTAFTSTLTEKRSIIKSGSKLYFEEGLLPSMAQQEIMSPR